MTEQDDKALWASYRAIWDAAEDDAVTPDAMTVAAYAEGRATAEEIDLVEAWIARDPARLDDILIAREAATEPLPPAYLPAIAQAKSLVSRVVERAVTERRRWARVGWGSVVAASILALVTGYQAATSYHNVLVTYQQSVERLPLSSEIGFGVLDGEIDGSAEL